jgi:glycosyltransferase involved in cell wall biosynthesis
MRREIVRTVHSLSHMGQRGVSETDYEVIVIDNGSPEPLTRDLFPADFANLRVVAPANPHPSPARALNHGASLAQGDIIVSMIDGARMASPGCVRWMIKAFDLQPDAVGIVNAWHIGPQVQNKSVAKGYNQTVEDRLFDTIDWRGNGYSLFDISVELDPSSGPSAWFKPVAESNFIGVSRADYAALNGFDEAFSSAGGGAVNLDFFRRCVEDLERPVVSIIGEGTFHQFHGGVSTNVEEKEHPWTAIHDEYRRIRRKEWACPIYEPILLGQMNAHSRDRFARSRNIITNTLRPARMGHRLNEAVKILKGSYTYHPVEWKPPWSGPMNRTASGQGEVPWRIATRAISCAGSIPRPRR